jgi:hypothetical protein
MSRWLALLTVVVCVAACAQAHREKVPSNDGGLTLDTEVMAYLSMARAMHHEANLKEDEDVPGAVAALERLTSAARPHPEQRVAEVEEVLADTFARKAELEGREGQLTKASDDVKQGLTHAPGPTYFRGHLLEVGGVVEETRSRALADAGKPAEAASAKARALDLLHQAVIVQEAVVRSSLADAAASTKGAP